jgi:hypothetical protein
MRQMFGKVATAQPMVLSLRFVRIANQKGGSSIKRWANVCLCYCDCGGNEITLSMTMSGAVEQIGKLVLVALRVSFGLLLAGYFMMPSLQQILGMIAIISIPFVMVGGYFLSAFFPQKKEVTTQ